MSSPDARPTPHAPGVRAVALPIIFVVATVLVLVLLLLTEPPTTGVPLAAFVLVITVGLVRYGAAFSGSPCVSCSGPVAPGGAAGGAVGGLHGERAR
jgi:hypothetical protein